MYLKGLEIQGFKSFPDRIKLDFNKGITAVVGPNGSGKSNISDAVRWVLGEKSAKSLRGAKMEDIIFSGTADRKPMGFAEVTLIMDNGDKVLNVDYSEVSVTRKVYRTGESEYLINGKTCRQRDILELFMDTGVGKEGYSIIGQGRIDEILSSKSEDRRTLFEEAAGIVKYKTRCGEAQNNLEHTHADLVRVNDIIAELETQIGPLEKQAEKTKKYLELYEELKKIQISIFVDDADRYEADIKLFDEQTENLKRDIEAGKAEQNRLENEKEKFRLRLMDINSELDTQNNAISEKKAEAEKRRGDIRLCDNNTAHINEKITAAQRDIELNKQAAEENNVKINSLKTQLNAKKIELANKTAAYEKRRSEMESITASLNEGEEQLNRFNDELYAKLNKRNVLNANVSELSAVLKQYEQSDKSSNELLSGYDGRIQQREAALAVQRNEAEGIELEGKTIADNMASLNAENERIKKILAEDGDKLRAVNREMNEKNSRLRVLSEFKNDYEGYYAGVKAVLKLRDSKTKGYEGIRGAVGEILTMPEKLETAVEIALGGAVQNIIADTQEDVKAAISYLKRSKAGRATFLPMDAVKGRGIGSDRFKIVSFGGVIGIAKELVSYDPVYEGIMSYLLDRVIIVDNIDNGIALARQTKYAYKIVTLDGDLFNAGGSMTGGSNNKKAAGIFSRTREITDLQQSLKTLADTAERLNATLAKAKERAEDIAESLNEAKEDMQRLAVEKREHNVNIEHIKGDIENLKNEKQAHIERMSELSQNLEQTKARLDSATAELARINDEIGELKQKVDAFNDTLKTDKQSRDLGNEQIILMSGEITAIKAEYGTIEADIERAEREIESLNAKNITIAEEIERDKAGIKEQADEKARLEGEAERMDSECAALLEKQKSLNEEKRKVTGLSEDYERRIRSTIQSNSGLENEHTRLMGKRETTEQRSRELYDRMFESYEITYVAAKAYPALDMTYDAKKKEETRLRAAVRQLGNVNVNAVEEYETTKGRYDTYISQRDDIINAEKEIKEIIAQLQTLMESRFREQFKVISENFSRVFAEMFEGGKAALKLADDEDVLNCGIDIEAQPPGKALQNMMLLSGGEKAMTAISLLFAILEMKPSPFCILDEIEAALDDANVVRFAEYLRNFTDTTQFIVITHRPGTREVADMLYGVTQERGISKLFSTNLDEIMKERE